MPQPPTITHADERRAFYRAETDTVNVPPLARFEKAAEYYSTLFHELTHATAHPSRLNRKTEGPQGFRERELWAGRADSRNGERLPVREGRGFWMRRPTTPPPIWTAGAP
jgi:hypothetical protein